MLVASRRQFLSSTAAATALSLASASSASRSALAAMGPNDKFDLLIKGGEVLDPSQNLRAHRDVGVRFGVIEALEANIPADKALKVLDASGKLVTPGLIDLHAHVFPSAPRSAFLPTSCCRFRQRPRWCRRVTQERTISPRSAATSLPTPAPGSMRSCTSQMSD